MTGYTVHTGSNEKFAGGWERVFGNKQKKTASQSGAKAGKKPAGKPKTK